ncbi:hypothetical protein DFH27DRAFT_516417 [Peziza echinospora]|nr:hypothetical protein DFH27DRAFT_516417 [Peziza echinospora]
MTIRYIQSPEDPGAITSAIRFRASPIFLLQSDLRLISRLKTNLLSTICPLQICQDHSEMRIDDLQNIFSIILQGILLVMPLLSFGIGVFLVVLGSVGVWPAWPLVFFMHVLVTVRCVKWVAGLLNWGDKTFMSNADSKRRLSFSNERWIFINGICTGTHWQQKNTNLLEDLFHRPILGIQNKTYGPVLDIVECILQRCFGYVTEGTRTSYEQIKQALQEPSLDKVVVIAHSQGGIILANVLDMLYADLPPHMLEKLEIYTFGSAANHFNNPSQATVSNTKQPSNCIKHVEHYCNRNDWVSKFGTIQFAVQPPEYRFFGKVFISARGGHLFNAHYLSKMFLAEYGYQETFLSQIVEIDEAVAVAREGRIPSWLQSVERSRPASSSGKRRGTLTSPPPARQIQQDIGLITMRDVSRLWKYLEGRSPQD